MSKILFARNHRNLANKNNSNNNTNNNNTNTNNNNTNNNNSKVINWANYMFWMILNKWLKIINQIIANTCNWVRAPLITNQYYDI